MNLFDSSFLCLDIGTSGVRGIAHRVQSGRLERSAIYTADSFDTVFALKSVIDELEKQIGAHFDSAYITGNFGESYFEQIHDNLKWETEHKITAMDIQNSISKRVSKEDFYIMHLIPLWYATPSEQDIYSPIGRTDRQLISIFGALFYERRRLEEIFSFLRRAHIQANAFYDQQYLQNYIFRKRKQNTMFIDLGAEFTQVSIWTDRGLVWHLKLKTGGTDRTLEISEKLKIHFDDAERIKRNVASLIPKEMDRFTPADSAYEFSRADINDIILPHLIETVSEIKNSIDEDFKKYRPKKIILTGGGAEIENISEFFENEFNLPVQNLHSDASVRALSEYIWKSEEKHRQKYISRHDKFDNFFKRISNKLQIKPKKKAKFLPILPSTLCFNMKNPETYSMFRSGGISMIHVDIMDGFYVNKIAGSVKELKYIHAHTNAHLHVHLMTESPSVWAPDVIAAGADTVILSTNTSGLREALRIIKASSRRAGIALNPDSSVQILKSVLREIDEVMVMAVKPGAAGQEFQTDCLKKISILAATRKKYSLKYTISVDGGINEETAKQCWDAGADLLISGSYLAKSKDFPLAVQSLLKRPTK